MKHNLVSGLVVSLTLASAAVCLAEGPMDCVTEMTMPYAIGQMMASIPARIEVQVTIGKDGLASSADYGHIKPLMRIALDQYFKEQSRYRPSCAGRKITFTLRYLVEGIPTPVPSSQVRFRPPNEFVIVAHPIEPSLDPIREQNPK